MQKDNFLTMACRNFSLHYLRSKRAVPRSEVCEVQPSCVVPNGETSPALAYRMYSKGESLPFNRGVYNADDGFETLSYPKTQGELMARRKEFVDGLVHCPIETDSVPEPSPGPAPAPPPLAE